MTAEYPFATDELVKGSLVPVEEIERVYKVDRNSKSYGLAVLRAGEYIMRRFADRGEIVTVRQERGSLRILDDAQAVDHNARTFDAGIAGALRSHRRMLGIDRNNLDADQAAKHDRRATIQGAMLTAASGERQRLTPAPVERKKPLPPGAQ